jgi:hypothetical protein
VRLPAARARPRIGATLAAALALPAVAGEVVLDAPEAAHWHAASGSWFVSNLGGGLSLANLRLDHALRPRRPPARLALARVP